MPSRGHDHRATLLRRLLDTALRAVHPGPATAVAVTRAPMPTASDGRVHVLALGKAAHPMAAAAVDALAARGVQPAGGLIVSHREQSSPHAALDVAVGDHPVPGTRSLAAADRLASAAAAVRPDDLALVLLSGGASSLLGAPVAGITPDELGALTETLLGAGADIGLVNLVRRRVARWGAGRLAAAVAGRVECLVLSDVPGHDATVVGSGPCSPDRVTAATVIARLRALGAWERVPDGVRRHLAAAERGERDVPPADDASFSRVRLTLLADNATACRAVVDAARAAGLDAELHDDDLTGESCVLGAAIGDRLRRAASSPGERTRGVVHVWGGEPVVTLHGAPADAAGGRMQELALAAAIALAGVADVALLAAGTDGRDGPTDAAGALVDGETCARIVRAGRDPSADLDAHRSHAALDAAGALLRTGATGTNVADLVLGLVAHDA